MNGEFGWLLQHLADVPADDGWLAAAEAARLATMRTAKRAAEFRLGRWTARRMLASWAGLPCPPDRLEIRAAEDGAPEPWLDGRRLPFALSLSHRDGVALCVAGPEGTALGCDVERVEARPESFVAEWLDDREISGLADHAGAARDARVTLLWSAKESALKALRTGLRRDPRDVHVRVTSAVAADGFGELLLRCAADPALGFPDAVDLGGCWTQHGPLLATIAFGQAGSPLRRASTSGRSPLRRAGSASAASGSARRRPGRRDR